MISGLALSPYILLLSFVVVTHQYTYSCNSSLSCGCSENSASVTRIVGGEAAGSNTWEWTVSISIASVSLCGGSLLSSSWVISAAHCFQGASATQVTVYVGSNTKYHGQSRVASRLILHPSYNRLTNENDIALIQLSPPLTLSNSPIKFICMPSVSAATLAASEWPAPGSYVVAVGWGTLSESGPVSSTLQQVTLQTIDYGASMCRSVIHNRQLQLCAGVTGGGKDTCQGDSGGPLMMFTVSRQWVLVGLTSYGTGCARPTHAGVYTRVAAYESWIKSTTGNAYTTAISSTTTNINPFTSGTFRHSGLLFSCHLALVVIIFYIIYPW